MCDKCIEIDRKIAHYRDIAEAVLDPQVLCNIDTMIAAMEDRKAALHPERKE